jgi:hypothetical protein
MVFPGIAHPFGNQRQTAPSLSSTRLFAGKGIKMVEAIAAWISLEQFHISQALTDHFL